MVFFRAFQKILDAYFAANIGNFMGVADDGCDAVGQDTSVEFVWGVTRELSICKWVSINSGNGKFSRAIHFYFAGI